MSRRLSGNMWHVLYRRCEEPCASNHTNAVALTLPSLHPFTHICRIRCSSAHEGTIQVINNLEYDTASPPPPTADHSHQVQTILANNQTPKRHQHLATMCHYINNSYTCGYLQRVLITCPASASRKDKRCNGNIPT